MPYDYASTGVPPHILELKVVFPVMIILNVLHTYLVHGQMYEVKRITPRYLLLSKTPGDGPELKMFFLHRIDFQSELLDVKVLRGQFLLVSCS